MCSLHVKNHAAPSEICRARTLALADCAGAASAATAARVEHLCALLQLRSGWTGRLCWRPLRCCVHDKQSSFCIMCNALNHARETIDVGMWEAAVLAFAAHRVTLAWLLLQAVLQSVKGMCKQAATGDTIRLQRQFHNLAVSKFGV